MAGLNDKRPSLKNDGHRNTDKIKQDIAQAEQEMSKTVEEIGERIKEKMDWQEYVRETPYVALGIAAGLGFLAAGMFVKKRNSTDRLLDTIADEVRGVAGGMVAKTAGPGVIKVTLLGIASKAAVNWLQNSVGQHQNSPNRDEAKCCSSEEKIGADSRIIV